MEQLYQINFFSNEMLLFIAIGFTAQLIDGTLGMGYGISCNTLLLSMGLSPALASASVHVAEIFTSATSAVSHITFKNVHKKLFFSLMIPGVIGSIIGAFLLSYFDASIVKPLVSFYLLLMGLIILKRGLSKNKTRSKIKNIGFLALGGGFLDAAGGGGWGAIVNSALLSKGKPPRLIIGTVNAVEFFVALASAGIFTFMLSLTHFEAIIGLIIGGVVAAPTGAFLVKKINTQWLLIGVGLLVCALSFKNLYDIIY